MIEYTVQKPSDKVKLIGRTTFEAIKQDGGAREQAPKQLKNSKYKRTHQRHQQFDLSQFITKKKPKRRPGEKRSKMIRRPVDPRECHTFARRRGKTREGGVVKRQSRLKKSILQYRQQKRMEERLDRQLGKAVQQFQALVIAPPPQERYSFDEDAATAISPMVRTTTIHSRRFRGYCDNMTTGRLGDLSDELMRELHRYQTRAFAANPIKARAHPRLVVGFREVQNNLRVNKLLLVLIAPDCENSVGMDGLNETIDNIKAACQSKEIPYGFGLRRRQLGYALYKKVPVSCVGVVDCDGARDIFNALLAELADAKRAYGEIPLGSLHLQNIHEMEPEE